MSAFGRYPILADFLPILVTDSSVSARAGHGLALLYFHELGGSGTMNQRTHPSDDRDLGVVGMRAELARRIPAPCSNTGRTRIRDTQSKKQFDIAT